jgi:hypothetical protein
VLESRDCSHRFDPWTPEVLKRPGTVPDRVIAEAIRVTSSTIAWQGWQRGIPRWDQWSKAGIEWGTPTTRPFNGTALP